MILEFKSALGTLRGPLGFRLGPIRRWIHDWLVAKGKPEGECSLSVEVEGQKATLTLRGRATKGIPKPDMTLQIIDNGEVVASRTWERVEVGEEHTVVATVTELDGHHAVGRLVLSNVIGTDVYTAEADYEIKPPPPPKPPEIGFVYWSMLPDGEVGLGGYARHYEHIEIDWGDGTVDRDPEWWNHKYERMGRYCVKGRAWSDIGEAKTSCLVIYDGEAHYEDCVKCR